MNSIKRRGVWVAKRVDFLVVVPASVAVRGAGTLSLSADRTAPPRTRLRGGRRVALLARYPDRDRAMPQFIPNLGLYMVEAELRASNLPDLHVRVWDVEGGENDVERVAAEVVAFDPDIVGCSVYLWSFPFFLDLACVLKDDDPSRLIVFGGPSARPVMLDHEPHQMKAKAVDLLVAGEGEVTFRDVVAVRDRSPDQLMRIAGVALRVDGAWCETPGRPLGDLNELASPYAMNLIPPRGLGVLQTYRGCPFTCSFCEWGTMELPKRVRTAGSLGAEFAAMERMGLAAVLLADAGLNLNQAAFQSSGRPTGKAVSFHAAGSYAKSIRPR